MNYNILPNFVRAKVVSNDDKLNFARVRVWIPSLMPLIMETRGIWARPGNNPFGGRNDENYCNYHGSCYIPPVGSWLFIFFENNNMNRPYYFCGLDIENAPTLPECRLGNGYNKWVVHKSPLGRTLVISDDPMDARVEITGRKRNITNPPSGDTDSVYQIDGNQNTILVDERIGKEKVLIRNRKGDFIRLGISDQKLDISVSSDINIKSGGSIYIQADRNIYLKSDNNINAQSGTGMNLKADGVLKMYGSSSSHLKSAGAVNIDGSVLNEQTGASATADDSQNSDPQGNRDT